MIAERANMPEVIIPVLQFDDLDFVDEFGVNWIGHEVESSEECLGCRGTVDFGLVGRYCSECVYLMER